MPRIGWYGTLAAALLLAVLALPAFCQGLARLDGPVPVESTPTPEVAREPGPAPQAVTTQPITLPAALRLADVRPIDIHLAQERLAAAAAQLQRAELLWLPTIYLGGAY